MVRLIIYFSYAEVRRGVKRLKIRTENDPALASLSM
jgi:hypothetical protein